MKLIDGEQLYEKTAEWEAQALHMVEVTMNEEDLDEWRRWSAILKERTAFKHDVADAPVIEERKTGEAIVKSTGYRGYWACDQCGAEIKRTDNFCPNCGADMRGEEHG